MLGTGWKNSKRFPSLFRVLSLCFSIPCTNSIWTRYPNTWIDRGERSCENTFCRFCSRWPKTETKTHWNENTNHAVLHLLCRVPQHRYGERKKGKRRIEAVKRTHMNWFQLYNFRVFFNANIVCPSQIQFNQNKITRATRRWCQSM